MTQDIDELDHPPFPPMDWCDCDWWEGFTDLTIGTDADLNVTVHDPSVTRIPSESQSAAYQFQLDNGERITNSVLVALREYYDEIRPRYLDFLGDEADTLMPAIEHDTDFRQLIDLVHVHIHPWTTAGSAYVGLQFSCTWDREHGLGVLMHRDRVVTVGGADMSFAFAPDEAENAT